MERQTKINFMRELSSLATHSSLKKGVRVKLLKPAKFQKMEMKNKQGTRDMWKIESNSLNEITKLPCGCMKVILSAVEAIKKFSVQL